MTNPDQFTDAEVEAVRTLKSVIDISVEELDDKQKAAMALVQSLADLHDVVGFVVRPHQFHTVLVFSMTKQAIFRLSKEQDIVLSTADRTVIPLAIEYDRTAKKWLGTEVDPNIAPIPGQPYPRKQPLVALAEAVVRAINTPQNFSSRSPAPNT